VTNPLHLTAFIQRLKARMDAPKNVLTLKTENGKLPEIRIDREYFAVFVNNKSLDLSKKEFELLYLLASQPGKNFTRQELFEKIWQEPLDENNRTIDVHIVRLRKKIGSQYIKTFKGIGYRFSVS
jgi:two-component system alkaline phosphatase synthesis response regulator PhoP